MSGTRKGPPLVFGLEESERSFRDWGMNCGPGAIAGVLGITPDQALEHLPGFSRKKYTTEIMLEKALFGLGVASSRGSGVFPDYGFARILWKGPWWDDPEPWIRERHSHWIGVSTCRDTGERMIFDINAIASGGWIPEIEWRTVTVPWLVGHPDSGSTGEWEISETYEIDPDILPPRPHQGCDLSDPAA